MFERAFAIWRELSEWRDTDGMMGVKPFRWSDLSHYVTVTGNRLNRLDRSLLRIIEGEFVASRSEAASRAAPSEGKRR